MTTHLSLISSMWRAKWCEPSLYLLLFLIDGLQLLLLLITESGLQILAYPLQRVYVMAYPLPFILHIKLAAQ